MEIAKKKQAAVDFSKYNVQEQSLLLRGLSQQIQQLAFPQLDACNHQFEKVGLKIVSLTATTTIEKAPRGLIDSAKLILMSSISDTRKCEAITKLISLQNDQ